MDWSEAQKPKFEKNNNMFLKTKIKYFEYTYVGQSELYSHTGVWQRDIYANENTVCVTLIMLNIKSQSRENQIGSEKICTCIYICTSILALIVIYFNVSTKLDRIWSEFSSQAEIKEQIQFKPLLKHIVVSVICNDVGKQRKCNIICI